jgi:uncharacterized protein (DUF488 family)
VLHTIGYEAISIGDFLATLELVGIDLVIDVRCVPWSRKPGFSKSILARWLASRDIQYLHLKELGDPKEGRIAAREGRYGDFWRIFTSHLRSDAAQSALEEGISAASNRFACLLCFERDHTLCHRAIVASEMARLAGFHLMHLGRQIGLTKGRQDRSAHDASLTFVR